MLCPVACWEYFIIDNCATNHYFSNISNLLLPHIHRFFGYLHSSIQPEGLVTSKPFILSSNVRYNNSFIFINIYLTVLIVFMCHLFLFVRLSDWSSFYNMIESILQRLASALAFIYSIFTLSSHGRRRKSYLFTLNIEKV